MAKVKNLKPRKCVKFLQKRGWELINRNATHLTFHKVIDGKDCFCQVIWNNKTIYWKNADLMIKKSGIPKKEWIKECK